MKLTGFSILRNDSDNYIYVNLFIHNFLAKFRVL